MIADLISSICSKLTKENEEESNGSPNDGEIIGENGQEVIFGVDLISAIEEDECAQFGDISCESFKFHDIGNQTLSKISNEDITWVDPLPLPKIKPCPFDFEFTTPDILWAVGVGGTTGHTIKNGMAAMLQLQLLIQQLLKLQLILDRIILIFY